MHMKPRREKTVSVRITKDEYELLEKLAEAQKVDKSDILRIALVDGLNYRERMGVAA